MTSKIREQAVRLFMNLFGTLPDYDSSSETMVVYTRAISKSQLSSLSRLKAKNVEITHTNMGIKILVSDYEY